MTEPLLPGASPTSCQCCHRPVPTGRVYGPGLGEKCARRRGVLPPRQPRVARSAVVVQDGPDLFDVADDQADLTPDVSSGIMYAVPPDEGGGLVQGREQGEPPPAGVARAQVTRRSAQAMERDLVPVIETFARQVGVHLTEWQKRMIAGMPPVQVIQPRRHSLFAVMEEHGRARDFRPLVNGREAAVLEQAGMREGEHFLRYPDTPEQDQPPADPMLRAIEAKRNRNTGPPKDRLDGRRRR